MDQTDLLWALLKTGQLDAVKNLNLECVDWTKRHDVRGYTFIVECVNLLIRRVKPADSVQVFDCIKLCISCGASPLQKCSESASTHCVWKANDKEGTKMMVKTAGLSAISYIEAWIDQLADKPEWKETYDAFVGALTCFSTAVPKQNAARVSIHEAVVELWEKQLAAKASHDLTFKTADGEVTAHAQMLKDASSVISAMLASPMKEGQAQTIWVKDASNGALSLFLEILVAVFHDFCSVQRFHPSRPILEIHPLWQYSTICFLCTDFCACGLIFAKSMQKL